MTLDEAGIVLKCLCGANMNSDMINVLFDDRGRVKIGGQPILCPVCGAIYRRGERVKYQLVPMGVEVLKGNDLRKGYIRRRYTERLKVSVTG